MKKISLLFIFLMAITFSFAQTDVIVTIDVNANTEVTDVLFKGTPSGWANIQGYDDGTNGDATAGDGIWSATFTDVPCDGTTHEWGAVDQNDTWLLAPGTANRMFTVDAQCLVTGDTDYAIPMAGGAVMLTLTVTDPNGDIGGISMKGAYDGWTSVAAYDDGTNGDMTAGDGVWTLQVEADMPTPGSDPVNYEWGAERTDCAAAAWIIQGPNRSFSVDDQGNVSGDTNYDVPVAGTSYAVTFRVYMGNEIVSADGVFVSGEFETCPWSKLDIPLSPNADDPLIYEATYNVVPGEYSWKFFNGAPGTDDGGENNGGTPFATVFQDEGCGVDNGFGGSNRRSDWTALSEATLLPVYTFNSCQVYISSSNNEALELDQFDINPNPVSDVAVISFTNDNAAAFDLVISDVSGKVVSTRNNITSNRVEVAANEMAPGMYFVTLRNEGGATTTRKLMVR